VAWPVPLAIKTTRRDELVENSIFDRGAIKAPNPSSVNSPALKRQFRCGGGSKIPDLVFSLKPVAVRRGWWIRILILLWQKINPALGAPGKLLSVTDWAPERFLSRGGSNEYLFLKSMKNREFFDWFADFYNNNDRELGTYSIILFN
jgi:hypothetical protein